MSISWTEKYRPTDIEAFLPKSKIKDIKKNKLFLISGSTSSGKTSLAYAIIKYLQCEPIEINCENVTDNKMISDTLQKTIGSGNVLNMLSLEKPTGLIIDDIEFLQTKSGLTHLKNYLKKHKGGPVVCTVTQMANKNILSLKKIMHHINLSRPSRAKMGNLIDRIVEAEGLIMEDDAKLLLIKYADGDYRNLINGLEFLKDQVITEDRVREWQKNMTQDREYQVKDAVMKIVNTDVKIPEILQLHDSGTMMVPLLLHENYPKFIKDMARYSDYLSTADLFNQKIFESQDWRLNNYIGILTAGGVKVFQNKNLLQCKSSALMNTTSSRYKNVKEIGRIIHSTDPVPGTSDFLLLSELNRVKGVENPYEKINKFK